VTSFMVFLAAFDVLLSRWSGQRDITVASPMAGRVRPELENLIGFFVNPLLLRTDLDGRPTGRELVRRVQDTCTAAYEHQEFPFEMASEILRTARDDAPGTPQAQAMLVLQNMAPAELRAGGLVIEPLRVDTRTAGFALALDLEADGAGGYRAWLEYSVELFTGETAAAMAGQFTAILGEMAASPDTPVSVTPVREPMHEAAPDMPSVATAVPADEPAAEPPYRAPHTPLETELHAVFSELLGADDIGVNEDFFALGGDSLSLIQLRNKVREQYGVEFSVRELFPTVDIEGLAWRILNRMLEDEDASPGTGGQARQDEEPGQRPGADKEQQS
jgi:non-ribosomal peptide synthetase component F